VRDFIRRLRDLEKLSDREGDAPTEEEASDVVRLLTIHGAKGLEFPVVVLADLARGLLIPERGLFACDPGRMALGTSLGGAPNLVYKAIDRARQNGDRQESARLLYVAMTRAREHLILCGNIGRNRGYNWADNLFPLLGVLDVPPEPEGRTLTGGISAQVAPMAYYAHAPLADQPGGITHARRASEQLADHLAAALLLDTSHAPHT
jgi:ATP-dependent helicase/nuclease subunit A